MSCSNRSSDICYGNFIFIFQYLHNLDVNSAFYDPKTRSMRENPFKLGFINKIGRQDSMILPFLLNMPCNFFLIM